MKSPAHFSTALETFVRFGATLDRWRDASGDGFSAIEPLLAPTGELSSAWPGRSASRPLRRIVDLGDDRFRAVCDEGLSEPVDLARDEIALWRAEERLLRDAICTALGLAKSRDALRPLPGLLRVGQWRFSQAAGCPVWLACSPAGSALVELLREAGATSGPLIVLLFTRAGWTAEAERAAPVERYMTAALDEVISDCEWVASDGWDLALGEFVKVAQIRVAGGLSTLKKKRIAQSGSTAAKLKDELRRWYRTARTHLLKTGEPLPAPELKSIAAACGLHPSTAGRWLNGAYREKDLELKLLWQSTGNADYIRQFRG